MNDGPPAVRARARWITLLLIVTPALAWIALAAGALTPLKNVVERHASAALGRSVTIRGRLGVIVTPWGIDLSAHGVRIANPSWARAAYLLDVASLYAHRSYFDILVDRTGFAAVTLNDGAVSLERSADGKRTSWPGRAPGSAFDPHAIRAISADRVELRYCDSHAGMTARLALRSRQVGAVVFAGEVGIAARRFTVAGEMRSGAGRPAHLLLAGWGGGNRFGAQGQADRPFGLGRSRLTVFAAGREAATLAGLTGLKLANVGDYAVAARALRTDRAWHFTHIAGWAGRTDLAGSLSVEQRAGRPRITARLASRALRLADAKLLFGVRGDPAMTAQDGTGVPAARVLPDATFSPAGLRAFDARIDYAAEQVVGLARPAGPLSLRLTMRRGVLVLSPVRLAMDGGFVSSDIVVDARRVPMLARYDLRLSPTSMGRLLSDWGVAPAGTTAMLRGRILLTGRGMTVRETLASADGRIALVVPAGDLRVRPASGSPLDLANLDAAIFSGGGAVSTINCAAIAFTVRDGVATTDPLLIDTAAHVLSGQGSIDLGTERLNLRLAAGSKRFSLFGRPSPVIVGGTLRDPTATREATSWLRPAELLGLEFSVPDLRALFRFVDPGDARPVTCPTS